MITSENYVEHVLHTDCEYTVELYDRLLNCARMLHAAMGLVTEAAELTDMLKKHIFYGKEFDEVNAKEELGDISWYVGLAIDEMSTTMNEVLALNIDKLKLRYPKKFSGECAINRNVDAERKLLETSYKVKNDIEPSSKRGMDFAIFADYVLVHIENYTIKQYGDSPNNKLKNGLLSIVLNKLKSILTDSVT